MRAALWRGSFSTSLKALCREAKAQEAIVFAVAEKLAPTCNLYMSAQLQKRKHGQKLKKVPQRIETTLKNRKR